MKKIIALVLALMMMASMTVVAFAETRTLEDTTDPIESQTSKVDVVYNVQKGYVVTIPDNLELEVIDDTADEAPATAGYTYGIGSGEVAILMAKLDGGETLTVSAKGNAIADTGVNTKWVLLDTKQTGTKADPIGYTITKGENTVLDQEDTIVSHTSGTDGAIPAGGKKVALSIKTNETSQAGNFKDVLTFLVAIA